MCGIAGTYSRSGTLPDREAARRALDRLHHRGPDAGGEWRDASTWFGHRRLSVLDLSTAGHQPMASADGRFVLVFNGEIYNHLELRGQLAPPGGWRGTSDTETLVEAWRTWGIDCLGRLNGMFAFAAWDRVERRLVIVRDRLGVKPLFFRRDADGLAFASRPGALSQLRGGLEMDPQALRDYLELGYVPAPRAWHRGVEKLPPAHYLVADERGTRLVRYWDYRHLSVAAPSALRPAAELVEELDGLVRDAVQCRLLADVPLGAFLSGGVDSALVVAMMQRCGIAQPRTFTIGFNEPQYDESAAAGAIARHLGLTPVMETVGIDSLLDLLPTFVSAFDEPLADPAAFPTLAISRLARRDVTVALTGDGGDELFAGYHYYPLAARLERIRQWPRPARALLATAAGAMPGHRAKLLAGALRQADPVATFHYLRTLTKDYPSLLAPGLAGTTVSSVESFGQSAASFADGLDAAATGMRLDVAHTLPDLYLQKVDVATMAYGLEARCPLTDYRLAEWALRLPVAEHLRGGHTKALLKQVLCRYLPAELVHRPKRGFTVPVSRWLRGPLLDWAAALLHEPVLVDALPLDWAAIRALHGQHVRGERDAFPVLWAVLMLLCFTAHQRGMATPAVAVRRAA